MSDCEDLSTALVRELTLGIENVEDVSAIYKKMAIIKLNKAKDELSIENTTEQNITTAEMLINEAELIINEAAIEEDKELILSFASEFKKVASTKRQKNNMVEGQLSLFEVA